MIHQLILLKTTQLQQLHQKHACVFKAGNHPSGLEMENKTQA